MAKHVHIHIHRGSTADAGFEESKHPRADNGQFGKGSGGSKGSAEGGKSHTETNSFTHPHSGSVTAAFPKHKASIEALKEGQSLEIKAGSDTHTITRKGNTFVQSKGSKQEKLSERQAMLREMGSPRYTGRTNPPAPDAKSLESHPMYAKEDFDYLTGKGYSPEEIKEIWDRDHKAGKEPTRTNKNSPEMQAHFKGVGQAMGIIKK